MKSSCPPHLIEKFKETKDPGDKPRASYDGRMFHWTTDNLDAERRRLNYIYSLHPSYN